MDLKQALKGNDKDIITMYAQIAYNQFGGTYIKEAFESSDYTFNVINEVVTVFPTTSYSLVSLKDLIKK